MNKDQHNAPWQKRLMPIILSFIFLVLLIKLTGQSHAMVNPIESHLRQAHIPFSHYRLPLNQKNKAASPAPEFLDYYLSFPRKKDKPIALWIQGSGCTSHFRRHAGRIGGGYQNVLHQVAKDWNIMIVEKPGVSFLDNNENPGTALHCSNEFKATHSLEYWGQALHLALEDALEQNDIASEKLLVIGHSEGAIASAYLASINPKVTHAALLSGSGISQLFDFAVNATTEQERIALYETYAKIQSQPEDFTQFWQGHPYKRWASFLRFSTAELLLNTQAKIFIAHGSADRSVPIAAFDALISELMRQRRAVRFRLLVDADHSLNTAEQSPPEGMRVILEEILNWAQTNDKRT